MDACGTVCSGAQSHFMSRSCRWERRDLFEAGECIEFDKLHDHGGRLGDGPCSFLVQASSEGLSMGDTLLKRKVCSRSVSAEIWNCLPPPEKHSQRSRLDSDSIIAESGVDRQRASAECERHGISQRNRTVDERSSDPELPGRQARTEPGGWELQLMASSRRRSAQLLASDVIGTIDFDPTWAFFATGGIARKIRIYTYSKMIEDGALTSPDEELDEDDEEMKISTCRSGLHNQNAAVGEICTPGKLGSLKWRPDGSNVIGCGDYDGVVMEWDIEYGHTVSERYEHSGQRVWSVDYSKMMPTLSASSSADGTVRLWSQGMDKSHLVLTPDSGNSVCSVQFCPEVDHLIVAGSADSKVYVYDLRKPDSSLLALSGHDRAVSHVGFFGQNQLVSASIDSTLKLWDIAASSSDRTSSPHLVRTFSSHTNFRHFVGLSIHRSAGILACGSETNELFMYSSNSTVPILKQKFSGRCSGYGDAPPALCNSYLGAVCWREQDDKYALVVANSEGLVQVLQATHLA